MSISDIKSLISDAIQCHISSGDFVLLEAELKSFNNTKLYQFQYFWQDKRVDDRYLAYLLNYREGELFKSKLKGPQSC